jgi:hypothetical protein
MWGAGYAIQDAGYKIRDAGNGANLVQSHPVSRILDHASFEDKSSTSALMRRY